MIFAYFISPIDRNGIYFVGLYYLNTLNTVLSNLDLWWIEMSNSKGSDPIPKVLKKTTVFWVYPWFLIRGG